MPVVPELPLPRRVLLASVESGAAGIAGPDTAQLTIDKILSACLLRDTTPRLSRLGVCSQRPPQLSIAEYQAAWEGITTWLRTNVHAQAYRNTEKDAKAVAVLGLGVVRHRRHGGTAHITVPYFELNEQFGRIYGLKGPQPSETSTHQAPAMNVITLTGRELAAVANQAASTRGTVQLDEHKAAHALGSLSHGLGLALGVDWNCFKAGCQPVRLWVGCGYLCSDGAGVVGLSVAYNCKDKDTQPPHSARPHSHSHSPRRSKFKPPSPSSEAAAQHEPSPPSAPRSARAKLQRRALEHEGRRLVLQATITQPLTPRQASEEACGAARVCVSFVSVLETCNPLLPGCTRVAASLLSSPSSRIGVHYSSPHLLKLLADLRLNAGETAVGGQVAVNGRETRGHTPRRRKYLQHQPTATHINNKKNNHTSAAPEDTEDESGQVQGIGIGMDMGEGLWLQRYAECLRSLQHPTHHTTAAFWRQLTASLPAASQLETNVMVNQRAQKLVLPAGVMQRHGACARSLLEVESEVESDMATQVLAHFQHRLCVSLLHYVLLSPQEAHRLGLEEPTATAHQSSSSPSTASSPGVARQREEYGRPLAHKDPRQASPQCHSSVQERLHQQACFQSVREEVERRLWVWRKGLQLAQLLQNTTTHNTFALVDLPSSLLELESEELCGPVSVLDLEARVSACLAHSRQHMSTLLLSPALQLLAHMTAQAPSHEAVQRLRRLGALLIRRSLRQVLRSSLLRLQAFFTLYELDDDSRDPSSDALKGRSPHGTETPHLASLTHKPAAIFIQAEWDDVNGVIVLEFSAEQLLKRLGAMLSQIANAFADPPQVTPLGASNLSLAALCLPASCLPLPLGSEEGPGQGDDEGRQLQALLLHLQHQACTIAHTALTHALHTVTAALGPTCARVLQCTAIRAPSHQSQGHKAGIPVGDRVGEKKHDSHHPPTTRSSKAPSTKPQPTWKRDRLASVKAVSADLALLRGLRGALHKALHSLMQHPWGLCRVDAQSLVQHMHTRLDQRMQQHKQRLTQALQERVSEVHSMLKRVNRHLLRHALAHFSSSGYGGSHSSSSSGYQGPQSFSSSSGYGDCHPPRSDSPTPAVAVDGPSLAPASAKKAIDLLGLDELLSLEGYLQTHAGADRAHFVAACAGVCEVEGVLVSQSWLSLPLGKLLLNTHHALQAFHTHLRWSAGFVARQREAWEGRLTAQRKQLIAAATDTQHTLHTVLAPRVLCVPWDLDQHMLEIDETVQSLDSVMKQLQQQRQQASALTHTMQRLGLGVMPIAGLEDEVEGGEGKAGSGAGRLVEVLRKGWGGLQALHRLYKHYTHDAPILLARIDVQQLEAEVWAHEQLLTSVMHSPSPSLEAGAWAVQLRGLRDTCTHSLTHMGHSSLRPRLPLLTALTCPHLTHSHWPAVLTALGLPLPHHPVDTEGEWASAVRLHDVWQCVDRLGSEEAKERVLKQLQAISQDASRDAQWAQQLTDIQHAIDALTIHTPTTVLQAGETGPPLPSPSPAPLAAVLDLTRVQAEVAHLQARLTALLSALPPASLSLAPLTAHATSLSTTLSACASLLTQLSPLQHLPPPHTHAPPALPLPLCHRVVLEEAWEHRAALLRLVATEPYLTRLCSSTEVRGRCKRLRQALGALEEQDRGPHKSKASEATRAEDQEEQEAGGKGQDQHREEIRPAQGSSKWD